jgi:hypothetical protein
MLQQQELSLGHVQQFTTFGKMDARKGTYQQEDIIRRESATLSRSHKWSTRANVVKWTQYMKNHRCSTIMTLYVTRMTNIVTYMIYHILWLIDHILWNIIGDAIGVRLRALCCIMIIHSLVAHSP